MGLRVIVAEDEAIIRLDLVELLKESGFDVVAQTNRGDEVLELVEKHKPDVAILDVKMPGLDGISATAQIAQKQETAVIILSAFSQQDLLDQAQHAGAQGYLVKPFHKAELIPAIETAYARFAEKKYVETTGASDANKAELAKKVAHAKAVLMDEHGLSESTAWQFISDTAHAGGRHISDVVSDIIEGTIAPQQA
jgi:AmiR/NasT family two-component response regulator